MAEGFTGGHAEAYRVHLLSSDDVELFEVGLDSGSIDGNVFREIPWGGSIVIRDPVADLIAKIHTWQGATEASVSYRYEGDDLVATNLARTTRTINQSTTGLFGMSDRWFGAGSTGTYAAVTAASDGPPGITSYRRKTWSTVSADDDIAVGWGTGVPVIPGEIYTFGGWVRWSHAIVTSTNRMRVEWRNASDALVSATDGPAMSAIVAGEWRWVQMTAQVPTTGSVTKMSPYWQVYATSGLAAGRTLDSTGFIVMKGAGLPYGFFDGDTPDTLVTATDWLNVRVGVTYVAELNGARIERRLMVGMVTNAVEDSERGFLDLELMDKCVILHEDSLEESTSYGTTEIVTEVVDSLIRSTGEYKVAIVPSGATLRTVMNFPVGTSKLTVVNALLSAIGYKQISVDGSGTFNSGPYLEPEDREIEHIFSSGPQSVHLPEVKDERDLFNIPNRVVGISTSNGENEALSSVAENNDPLSIYSIPSRGRVITRREEGIEAATQDVLDRYVASLLRSSSQVTWRQTIQHFPLGLSLGSAVTNPSGYRATVVEMKQTLTAGELTETVVRRFDNVA